MASKSKRHTRRHKSKSRKTRRHRGGGPPDGHTVCMHTDGQCYTNNGHAGRKPYKTTKDKYCDNPKAPQCDF